MLVNVNGQWTSVPDDTPATLPWNAGLTNPAALGDNRGCPPGYFAQYVPGFLWGTTTICRRFDQEVGTNPAVVAAESGDEGLIDATMENVAAASQAVVEGAGEVVSAAGSFLAPSALVLVLVAAAYFYLTRR